MAKARGKARTKSAPRSAADDKARREAGCAFCGTLKRDLPELVLIQGQGASICLDCAGTVRDVLESRGPGEGEGHPPPDMGCDFCGKKDEAVRGLIMGAMGGLCSNCARKVLADLAARG